MSFAIAMRCSPLPWPFDVSLTCLVLLHEDIRTGFFHQSFLPARKFPKALLPLRGLSHARDLDRGDLVLRAIGCPVRVLRRDHVGAGFGEMEGRVHHAR